MFGAGKNNIYVFIFPCLLFFCLSVINCSSSKSSLSSSHSSQNDCDKLKPFTVRGDSLQGVLNASDEINAAPDYYQCHEIERNDVILYQYAGNPVPIVKIVKGIPGDTFELRERDGNFELFINDQLVKTSTGKPYSFGSRAKRMLALYERDYKNKIPEKAYLILGNLTKGSLDSSRFGLVHEQDILGKVIAKR